MKFGRCAGFCEMGPEVLHTRFIIPCRPRYRMVLFPVCSPDVCSFFIYTCRQGFTEHVLKQSRVCICVNKKRCEHLDFLRNTCFFCTVSVNLLIVRIGSKPNTSRDSPGISYFRKTNIFFQQQRLAITDLFEGLSILGTRFRPF